MMNAFSVYSLHHRNYVCVIAIPFVCSSFVLLLLHACLKMLRAFLVGSYLTTPYVSLETRHVWENSSGVSRGVYWLPGNPPPLAAMIFLIRGWHPNWHRPSPAMTLRICLCSEQQRRSALWRNLAWMQRGPIATLLWLYTFWRAIKELKDGFKKNCSLLKIVKEAIQCHVPHFWLISK